MRALAAAFALFASPAFAHGALSNGGGFYAGLPHPLLTVSQPLLLIGLGFLLGRQPARPAPGALAALALALLAGLALSSLRGAPAWVPPVVLAAALAAGATLAANLRPSAAVLAGFAALAGLAVGLDTDVPAPAEGGGVAAFLPYAGVLVGVFLLTLNAMALASVAARPPYTIALRVAGSWIAAVAVLSLALLARGPGAPA